MKKLVSIALVAAVALPLFAQEAESANEVRAPREERKRESSVWPAFFAVCEFPANPDVIGLRLTIPFSTKQENVTGIDVGLWGRSLYFQGLQVNLLRCDLQVGLWNEANSMQGAQVGLVNYSGETEGFQVGIINRAETLHGYQIGLINVIRDAELQFCPIVNIGF